MSQLLPPQETSNYSPLKQAWADYEAFCRNTLSYERYVVHAKVLGYFLGPLKEALTPQDVTPADLSSYFAKQPNSSKKYLEDQLWVIQDFWNWMIDRGAAESNIALQYSAGRREKKSQSEALAERGMRILMGHAPAKRTRLEQVAAP